MAWPAVSGGLRHVHHQDTKAAFGGIAKAQRRGAPLGVLVPSWRLGGESASSATTSGAHWMQRDKQSTPIPNVRRYREWHRVDGRDKHGHDDIYLIYNGYLLN
ncbi:MAG: hypothetical protein HY985_12300 [Magnetospirillum sp.]|nr:hypothetical protein [Magnetospirillum sp.]